jgi:hypothetical protein
MKLVPIVAMSALLSIPSVTTVTRSAASIARRQPPLPPSASSKQGQACAYGLPLTSVQKDDAVPEG